MRDVNGVLRFFRPLCLAPGTGRDEISVFCTDDQHRAIL